MTGTTTPTPTMTMTPTPTLTPGISQTPSNTPTITPTLTSCPETCCFPNYAGSFSGAASLVQFIKFNPDYSFFLFGNDMTNLNGQLLRISNRISPCGEVLNAYSFGNIGFGGVDYGGVATQSTDKTLVIEEKSCRRLNPDYSIDTTFSGGYATFSTGDVNRTYPTGIAMGENDKYYICGILSGWTYYAGGSVGNINTNIFRFNPDGDVDTSFSGNNLGVVIAGLGLGQDPYMFNDYDGKIMITTITSWNGDTSRKGLIRLNPDGTLDTTFSSSVFSGVTGTSVNTATALPNGQYMVGGSFTDLLGISGQTFLVRLNNDGSLDTSFINGAVSFSSVKDVEPQSTGKYIVYSNIRVFRLNTDGSIDPTFTIGVIPPPNLFGSIAISPQDNILVGGNFNTYNSQSYRDFVKLDPDGNLDMCPELSPTPTPTSTTTPTRTLSLITPTPTTTPTNTSTQTPTPSMVSYMYAGGASQWSTSVDACTNKTCARPYYKSVPSWAPGTIVYDDMLLTTPTNGNNLWIAVDTSTGTFCSGLAWAAVQVDPSGVILNFVSCP